VGGSHFRAAVASLQAASQHGLEVLAYPINDVPETAPVSSCCSVRLPSLRAAPKPPTAASPSRCGRTTPAPCSMPCAASPSAVEHEPDRVTPVQAGNGRITCSSLTWSLPADSGSLEQAVAELAGHCEHLSCSGLPNQQSSKKNGG